MPPHRRIDLLPTVYTHQIRAEGPKEALEGLRSDSGLWQAQPWRSMFGLGVTGDVALGSLTFQFEDDAKRVGPSAADLAAAHPDLTFSHEFSDEDGSVAGREVYAGGVCVEEVRLDAEELRWIEWEEAE